MDASACDLPLERIDLLVVNAHEAAALMGRDNASADAPDRVADGDLRHLGERVRGLAVVTLGAQGAAAHDGERVWRVPAAPVSEVIDTTAAGDTFTGYLLAALVRGRPPEAALQHAASASALAVGRSGAIPSIPHHHELTSTSHP